MFIYPLPIVLAVMEMGEIKIKIPNVGEESLKRLSIVAERAVLQEWRRDVKTL